MIVFYFSRKNGPAVNRTRISSVLAVRRSVPVDEPMRVERQGWNPYGCKRGILPLDYRPNKDNLSVFFTENFSFKFSERKISICQNFPVSNFPFKFDSRLFYYLRAVVFKLYFYPIFLNLRCM